MKRIILLCSLILLLVACSNTKVIRLDDANQQQTYVVDNEAKITQPVQETSTQTSQQTVETTKSTTTSKSSSSSLYDPIKMNTGSSSNNSTSSSTTQTFDASKEFNIISCCNEGIIQAETKQQKSTYTAKQTEEIILAIQNSKCDELSSLSRYRINLKFKNEPQDEVYLKYIKEPIFKEIKVLDNVVSKEFDVCN